MQMAGEETKIIITVAWGKKKLLPTGSPYGKFLLGFLIKEQVGHG